MDILGHDLTATLCQFNAWCRLLFSPQATLLGRKTLQMDFFQPKGKNKTNHLLFGLRGQSIHRHHKSLGLVSYGATVKKNTISQFPAI